MSNSLFYSFHVIVLTFSGTFFVTINVTIIADEPILVSKNSEIVLLPTKKHWTNLIVHHRRCLSNTRACTCHVSTRLRKRTIVWNSAGYPTTSTADTKLCRSPDNMDAEVRTHHASVGPPSLVADSSTDSIQSTCVDLLCSECHCT